MDHLQYLLLLAGCGVVTLPLELSGSRVYRRPRRLARAVLPVAVVFMMWDVIAIAAGVWSYNPRYVTGVTLPLSLPVEEALFFLVVPVCALLTFETVRRLSPGRCGTRTAGGRATVWGGVSGAERGTRHDTGTGHGPATGDRGAGGEWRDVTGLGYTVPAVLAVAVVVALELGWFRTGLFRCRAYWITMVIVFGFQVVIDGWLTKLSAPIVRYDPHQLSGPRFPFDIPIEDFLFGFALVTATLLAWQRSADHRDTTR